MKIPGRNVALILTAIGIVTCFYPILSLPCSITGLIQASQAKRFIKVNGLKADSLINIASIVAIVSICFTALLILLAVSVAIQRLS